MYKINIIGTYFGKLPKYFPLWLNSCRYNETIDFLIITDQNIKDKPKNVSIVNISFDEFKNIVRSKFEFKISIERPYKICDFRPAFGLIFRDYLYEYDFWGHCDFDMIFGNLRGYFTDELLSTYDKILPLGHLSLYRNISENNNRFKLDGSIAGDYKTVFANDKSYAFDETDGIYQIYKHNNIPIYDKRIFADISEIYKRFRLAQDDINYKYQIFCFDEGKVYREYFLNNNYYRDEFIYIHIKKPKNLEINFNQNNCNRFFITNTGFYEKTHDTKLSDIEKYNKYQGKLYETYEKDRYFIINKTKRLLEKINIIGILR